MEFRVLGPLEVSSEGRLLDLGGAKQRALLAMLLLDANSVVSTSRLIEGLWEDDPPETAQKALQVHVSGLRKVVGKERVVTKEPGLPAAGRGRRARPGPVSPPPGAGQAGRRARALARGTAVGVQLEPLRPVGDRPAGGRATRMSRGAHRSGPQSRSAHRADRRAGGARPAISAARAAARAADPRPVPLRTPGRSAGRLPGGSARTRRRARDRAGQAAARPPPGGAEPGSRARSAGRGSTGARVRAARSTHDASDRNGHAALRRRRGINAAPLRTRRRAVPGDAHADARARACRGRTTPWRRGGLDRRQRFHRLRECGGRGGGCRRDPAFAAQGVVDSRRRGAASHRHSHGRARAHGRRLCRHRRAYRSATLRCRARWAGDRVTGGP